MSDTAILGLHAGDLAPGRPYAERAEPDLPWHDRTTLALWRGLLRPLWHRLRVGARRERGFVARVDAQAAGLATLSDDALRQRAAALRAPLRARGFEREAVAQAFALVREASERTLGRRPYDTQLAAGWLLLQGTLVEMATGEGKSLAATLPAVVAAWAGLPVHVITVNDYLAERDAQALAPLYRFFGLSVAAVLQGQTRAQRRNAYASAVTYASNKELAFDYLRDRAALGDHASPLHRAIRRLRDRPPPDDADGVLRGLVFGLVDEADSVFIDEARTPLILSTTGADGGPSRQACDQALAWAGAMTEGEHYTLDRAAHRVALLDPGVDAVNAWLIASEAAALLSTPREAEHVLRQALLALHVYQRDQQYLVADGQVQIVDEATGRAMPDRAWEQGLHQMIEAKEALALTGQRQTLARITYQRLFGRYLRLAGMSGTATEVAAEIGRSYGLPVMRVALRRPGRRAMLQPRCLPDRAAKWQAVADAAVQVAQREGRPVLIGTRTVQASEELAAVLTARGLAPVVLNARQDGAEAQVIAQAGEPGRVTVATNMAGRGTDILLAPGVAERGGLHVILTELHSSRRIDRQLFGRSARQGEPGSGQAIVALDDELFTTHAPRLTAWLARRGHVGPLALALLQRVAQAAAERRHRLAREATLRMDRQLVPWLAFSGRGE